MGWDHVRFWKSWWLQVTWICLHSLVQHLLLEWFWLPHEDHLEQSCVPPPSFKKSEKSCNCNVQLWFLWWFICSLQFLCFTQWPTISAFERHFRNNAHLHKCRWGIWALAAQSQAKTLLRSPRGNLSTCNECDVRDSEGTVSGKKKENQSNHFSGQRGFEFALQSPDSHVFLIFRHIVKRLAG